MSLLHDYIPNSNLISITDLPDNAVQMDIYVYKQTKSKVGRRWVRVKVESFTSQGFNVEAVPPFVFPDNFKNDLAARVQIPVRMLFGSIE